MHWVFVAVVSVEGDYTLDVRVALVGQTRERRLGEAETL
jgi:hypothetical protein